MAANKVIQYGLGGFEFTEEYRIPEEGEFYAYERYLEGKTAVFQSGGKIAVRFPILVPVEHFVQVRIPGIRRYQHWTYRDPSGSLKVGDAVQVPFGYDNTLTLGLIVGFGRGDEYGGSTKAVEARLVPEAL